MKAEGLLFSLSSSTDTVFIFFFFLLAKVAQINKPPRNSSINIPNHPYFQLNLQKIKANSNTDLYQLRIYSNNSVGQIIFNQFGHEMMYFTKKELQTTQIFTVHSSIKF